jgi:glyoxylase-like metal-dependent hydrolase (beta-lactamase superfamily II)
MGIGIKNNSRLQFEVLTVGHCHHPEFIVQQGGSWQSCKFPALCGLIKHPTRGYFLYDTGYSNRFFQETTKFPFQLYSWFTPVKLPKQEQLIHQLSLRGIQPEEIQGIFISHFHADHIAGIRDFPNAQLICMESAFREIQYCTGFKALRKAFIPNLLPKNIEDLLSFAEPCSLKPLPQELAPFSEGFDLFGDQSIFAIPLEGHTEGQMGLLFLDKNQQYQFFVADSCWTRKAYQELKLPSKPAQWLFSNKKQYFHTLQKLNFLYLNNPGIQIIPSHCS